MGGTDLAGGSGGGGTASASASASPASAAAAQRTGTTFRAQLVGLVKADAASGASPSAVLSVLRGMCLRYESFERVEYGFAAPLQSGTTAAALRLFRHKSPAQAPANPFAPPPPPVWTLAHESAPLRGPAYAALPATVREVAEANLHARDAPAFLEGLGARLEYAVQKSGNYYVCRHQGLEVQVAVYSAAALSRGGAAAANLTGKHWVLEAEADAASERQADVAKLLGSFAERLLPHVELKRPA